MRVKDLNEGKKEPQITVTDVGYENKKNFDRMRFAIGHMFYKDGTNGFWVYSLHGTKDDKGLGTNIGPYRTVFPTPEALIDAIYKHGIETASGNYPSKSWLADVKIVCKFNIYTTKSELLGMIK